MNRLLAALGLVVAVAIALLDRAAPRAGSADAEIRRAALGGAGGGAGDRDAVWRQIFARPPSAPLDARGAALAALGRRLFHDPRLSGAGSRACASCHDPARGFSDGLKRARGSDGRALARNTPSLINVGFAERLFWDGRAGSLEAQARVPILAPRELGGDFAEIGRRLADDRDTATAFSAAFGGGAGEPIEEARIVAALAAYERTIVAPETRFDRWVEGDSAALSTAELAGLRLFTGKAGCVACHGGWRLTDDALHDIGLPAGAGSEGASGADEATVFKTPGLRELLATAPYMHDGRFATLDAVIDHYAGGGLVQRPSLAPNLNAHLTLSADERAALTAFLLSLSSAPSLPQLP